MHTDSRSLEPGDLFVALRGDTYDANNFLHQAKERGASALLCHSGLPASQYPQGLPRIEVAESTQSLGQLAQAWRAQFSLPLIAVTGSNGKTTVTQMIAAILQQHVPDGTALATQGNLNNAIGVPLTVLRLRAKHRPDVGDQMIVDGGQKNAHDVPPVVMTDRARNAVKRPAPRPK